MTLLDPWDFAVNAIIEVYDAESKMIQQDGDDSCKSSSVFSKYQFQSQAIHSSR